MTNTHIRHVRVEAGVTLIAPQIRNVARDLMVYETQENESSEPGRGMEFNFNERLRPHVETLYGVAGYRSLLSRALVLADSEIPWLRRMHMKSDGSLDGQEAVKEQLGSDEILEGKVALLAQLLESLVAYAGTSLASRLVSEVWPTIPPNKLGPDGGCER